VLLPLHCIMPKMAKPLQGRLKGGATFHKRVFSRRPVSKSTVLMNSLVYFWAEVEICFQGFA
jgi:hypothetical protein